MSRLVAIVGPTASGKSALAMRVAERYDGEIICADSRTLYRGLDIGTAKPTKADRATVPHHLLDVIDPDETYSAAQFKVEADRLIEEISGRGRLPILVGGSGLYLYGALYDYSFPAGPSNEERLELERLTTDQLIDRLAAADPETLASVDRANRRRLIRAIETVGLPKGHAQLRPETLVVGLRVDGEELRQRISGRVDQMVKDGFVDEIKRIVKLYGWDNEAMTSIGYRAFRDFIEGRSSLEEAEMAFANGDWQLAKRQLTWFKRNPDIEWFDDPDRAEWRIEAFMADR